MLGVAPHSLRAVSLATLNRVAGMVPDGPIHIHIAEQVAEVTEVEAAWESIKAVEKAGVGGYDYRADLLHGVPTSLPGGLAADKVLARVRRRGLTPDPDAVARVERARAALAAAESEVRAALEGLQR